MYGARFVVMAMIFMSVSAVVFVYSLFGHLLRFNQLETLLFHLNSPFWVQHVYGGDHGRGYAHDDDALR